MKIQTLKYFSLLILLLSGIPAYSQVVRFETNFGNIDIEMNETASPQNVQNFLNYVNDGDYDNSIIHRSIQDFVIQGGAFRSNGNELEEIPAADPVVNEFSRSNVRGTVAMAKLGGDPDSATNNFFFNLADNSSNLDNQNEGFTVVGEVVAGMDVVDILGSIKEYFAEGIPLVGYNTTQPTTLDNYVYINRAFVLSGAFQINAGLSGAWFNPQTDGQGLYIEVLPDVNLMIVGWYTFDENAPDDTVPSSVGDASNRWLTAIGNFDQNTFVGTVYKTSGGLFDNPQGVSNTVIGSMNIVFNDCTTAVFSYMLDDSELSNTMNIQRVAGSNVALCEQLADEANQGVAVE